MRKSDFSDLELISAYLDREHDKFDIVYERYRKPLYSYLNKMIIYSFNDPIIPLKTDLFVYR